MVKPSMSSRRETSSVKKLPSQFFKVMACIDQRVGASGSMVYENVTDQSSTIC
jgi:hypothetical protein